jgi:arylsulfatase A-like enzyme
VSILGWAPANARRLSLADNLRFIFLERAPLLGLGVELATALAPPPPLEPEPVADDARSDTRLEIDWRGRDIVLISVDALRADHVGAYGYARPTTPHIDALAREGTLFLRAYCPTPHTSYSVTSMMTGKNLRPLLVQGLGMDSDTFAGILRTYGYRTAAFYPPAVFFIDEELFAPFRDSRLGFEYARVEFADPHQRADAVRAYLDKQPIDRKVFLWVHLFEPHEPYVLHPEHPFGERDIDRYDSEIALADEGIGEVVGVVRGRRPNAIVMVTADHGEEFGEHQGRYHGTTVYEEQVRVPLVVAAPGLPTSRRVEPPVQTIDILPTVLAALDVPRPPRIRGRNLARWLQDKARASSSGRPGAAAASAPSAAAAFGQQESSPAFAATDEQTLLADAEWRLVCARRAGACALYNLDLDPGELRDVSPANLDRFTAMKAALRRIEASQGRYENAGAREEGGKPWPDAIRRGLAGDGESAREVAALLDDSDVAFRRKAAEVLFDLKRKEAAPELRLALSRDEDDVVRRWCALALTRLGEGAPRTTDLLDDADVAWRRLAALALAENGDSRGSATLVAWWQSQPPPPYLRAREVLDAFAQIRSKEAAPALIRSLDDVRLRPYIAETLAAIGLPSARAPLVERLSTERYQNARVATAEALVRLGAKSELVDPLVRFLGTPDPLPNGLELARRAGILGQIGGPSSEEFLKVRMRASQGVLAKFVVPRGGNGTGRRIFVRGHVNDGRPGFVRVGLRLAGLETVVRRTAPAAGSGEGAGELVELDPRGAVTLEFQPGAAAEAFATLPAEMGNTTPEIRLVVLSSPNVIIDAMAVVPLSNELAPPPPEPWSNTDDSAADGASADGPDARH